MLQHRISGLPVVGEDERIVGIITESDLLQKASGPSPLERLAFLRPEQAQELEQHLRRYEAKVASEMMTRPVVTAEETTSLRELARLMADRTSVMRSIDGVVDVDSSNLAWEKDNRLRPGRR